MIVLEEPELVMNLFEGPEVVIIINPPGEPEIQVLIIIYSIWDGTLYSFGIFMFIYIF